MVISYIGKQRTQLPVMRARQGQKVRGPSRRHRPPAPTAGPLICARQSDDQTRKPCVTSHEGGKRYLHTQKRAIKMRTQHETDPIGLSLILDIYVQDQFSWYYLLCRA